MKKLRRKVLSLFMVFALTAFTFIPFINVKAETITNVEAISNDPIVENVSSSTILADYINTKKTAFINALSEHDTTAINNDLQYYFSYDEEDGYGSYYVFDHVGGNTVYCKKYMVLKQTGTPITSATINVSGPVIGSTISPTYFDNITPSGANYRVVGNFITSFENEQEVTGTITAGDYYIVFWLEPKSGYYFTDDYTLTINGALEQRHNHGRHYVKVAAKQGTPQDVYIDNTVDNSKSYVTGVIKVKDLKTGEVTEEKIYNQEFAVTYSNPKTSQVQEAIESAYNLVNTKASEKYANFSITTNESTGRVWDNRRYDTIEDGDAISIGNSDYLTGAYGANDNYTRTHIASGDFGKETFYIIEAMVECTSDTEYKILNGENGEYIINSGKELTIRANGNIDNFVELKVDGETLDSSNYTVKSGSTIATLKSNYLDTLSVGTHTLTFVYNDGTVDTTFTIANPTAETIITNNPQTGDNVMFYISMLGLSIIGLAGAGLYTKKKLFSK